MTAVGTMLYGFPIAEGIPGDLRHVVILCAGLFEGFWVAGIAALVAGAFRMSLDGPVLAGLLGMLCAAILGGVFHRFWTARDRSFRWPHYLALGVLLAVSNALIPLWGFFTASGLSEQAIDISLTMRRGRYRYHPSTPAIFGSS